jgi:hypothetical protein
MKQILKLLLVQIGLLFLAINCLAQKNNALHFDGTDDRVFVGNSSLFNTSYLTVQAWVKLDYIGGWSWRGVVTKRNCCGEALEQWTMQTTTGGLMNFFGHTDITGFSVTDPNPVPLNVWTNYAGTYDGNKAILYKNGVIVAKDTAANGKIISKEWPVVIGDRDGGLDWFPGAIDEVRIWDRALSQSEIQANINCKLTGNESGLVAYYDFNQGTATGNNTSITTLFDKTPNHLDGTLQNFTLNGTTSNWISNGIVTSKCLPALSIANKSTLEGNFGTKQLKFPVTLSNAYASPVKVKYKTINNTAKAGSDYIMAIDSLIFNPGQTSKTISITIKGDRNIEPNENFFVLLYQPKNATISNDTATGTILNDDGATFTDEATVIDEVKSVSLPESFQAFPNPVKNVLYIQAKGNAVFYLIDAKGKLMLSKQLQNSGVIDCSVLPNGLYFLKNSSIGEAQKIIIEK